MPDLDLDTTSGTPVYRQIVEQIRALQPDAVKLGDRRAVFVGVEAYEAEGGRITRDLFSAD